MKATLGAREQGGCAVTWEAAPLPNEAVELCRIDSMKTRRVCSRQQCAGPRMKQDYPAGSTQRRARESRTEELKRVAEAESQGDFNFVFTKIQEISKQPMGTLASDPRHRSKPQASHRQLRSSSHRQRLKPANQIKNEKT